MKPEIRVATTPEGHIEAVVYSFHPGTPRLVVDRQTGDVVESNVQVGTDNFRWLITAAREHVSRPDRRECI